MNAAKITLTSTLLAAALGLALGLWAAPALAGPPDPQGCHLDHKAEECPASDGGDVTIYTVTLSFLTVLDTYTSADDGACTGTTDIQANPGLTVQMIFNPGCFVSMTAAPEGMFPVEFYPFMLEVKTKKELSIVRLGFTTSTVLYPVPNDTVYMTDFMTATRNDGPGEGEFVLTPMTADGGEQLTKIHQPGKGAVTEERVMIGAFTYTPIP